MAKLATGIMIVLFWTGLANGPAGASSDQGPASATQVRVSASPDQHDAMIDFWLADVAACEAGVQSRCAPILL